MKISIFGVGYVGQVTGTCFADMGNDVLCMDIDPQKIESLKKGEPTIHEAGLKEILVRNFQEGRLRFTTSAQEAVEFGDLLFICVNTPESADGTADLTAVTAVADEIARYMKSYKIIITKSTVSVGTTNKIKQRIAAKTSVPFDVASNPEFLREGRAVSDFIGPDRVIVGVESPKVGQELERLYKFCTRPNRPLVIVDITTSELIKYASNSMLATRISFMNMLACLCSKIGADVKKVAHGMGLDDRIGTRFLQAGVGFGGSCFPKDVHALVKTLEEYHCDPSLLQAVLDINRAQKLYFLKQIVDHVKEKPNPVVTLWGLSFKPDTDDMREAPAVSLINELQKHGIMIQAFDPVAMENAKRILTNVKYAKTPYEAAAGADALVLMTEWNEFRLLDFSKVKSLMRSPLFFDGRNVLDPKEIRALGFTYYSIGRP